jgi:hypothetical protein
MRKLITWLAVGLMYSASLKAQSIGTDSRGKDIFDFYKASSMTFPISSANTSFKFNVSTPIFKSKQLFIGKKGDTLPYVRDVLKERIGSLTRLGQRNPPAGAIEPAYRLSDADSARLTYQQSYGLNMAFEASNVKTDITHLATFHPSYSLSVGISQNIDLFNNWDQIDKLGYFSPHPWSITAYGKLDNVMLYDTLSKGQNRHKPMSYGLTGEIAIMPYNYWFLSVSANYERGNNLTDLVAYQANTPTYTDPQVIALGDVTGKLGAVQKKDLYRLRLSSPIILPAIETFTALQPCIIPYYIYYGAFSGKSNHMFGLYANLLGERVHGKHNASIVSGAGVGIDWTKNSVWSHKIFVSGSLDLYKISRLVPGHTEASSAHTKFMDKLF